MYFCEIVRVFPGAWRSILRQFTPLSEAPSAPSKHNGASRDDQGWIVPTARAHSSDLKRLRGELSQLDWRLSG